MAEKKKIYRIAVVLKEKGINNNVLAKLMEVEPETVSRWCKNLIQPSPENLYKIAELTKTNLQKLLIETTSWPEGISIAELEQAKYENEQKLVRKRKQTKKRGE